MLEDYCYLRQIPASVFIVGYRIETEKKSAKPQKDFTDFTKTILTLFKG